MNRNRLLWSDSIGLFQRARYHDCRQSPNILYVCVFIAWKLCTSLKFLFCFQPLNCLMAKSTLHRTMRFQCDITAIPDLNKFQCHGQQKRKMPHDKREEKKCPSGIIEICLPNSITPQCKNLIVFEQSRWRKLCACVSLRYSSLNMRFW